MEIKCPQCGKILSPNSININTDLAKCENCNNIFKISEAIDDLEILNISSPTIGSKISLSKNDEDIEIVVPAKKFSASDIFPIFFALFWVGFLVFWTIGAAKGSILFALFSIPFWIMGTAMIIGLINSFDEDNVITIKREGISLFKNRPINSKEYSVKYSDIYSIKMGNLKFNNPLSMASNFRLMSKLNMMGIQTPTLNFGNESINFFEQASEAEQDWIIRLLNIILKKYKKAI